MDAHEIKAFIRDVIEEEFCPNPVGLAERWQGGEVVLNPGNDSQSKTVPMDVFFKKLISVRDSLRVLEQKVNSNAKLSTEDKVTLQAYVTKAYGTLTTFNVLFKDGKDRFVGSGSGGGGPSKSSRDPKMSIEEAREKIGINEYGRG